MPDFEYVATQPVGGFMPGDVVPDDVAEASPHCVVRRVKTAEPPAKAD